MLPERGEGCRCNGKTPNTFSIDRDRFQIPVGN